MNKTWAIVLITCLINTGCITTPTPEWLMPQTPQTEHVEFDKVEGGYFLSNNEAMKLANNIDELKAYTDKMEILVREMKKHYGAK